MRPATHNLIIRAAHGAELEQLNTLILRSKAVWGYDDAFMETCKDELSLCNRDLEQTEVAVAERAGTTDGVAQIQIIEREAELLKLFIEPCAIGSGAGRALFEWACHVARNRGAQSLLIDSDPDAAAFYRHMGACDIGLAPSGSVPGRMLPMLAYALTE